MNVTSRAPECDFGEPYRRTRAVRTDARVQGWDLEGMTRQRKRKTLDLFLDALTHPVRFRAA
jgi:hypothetical protein